MNKGISKEMEIREVMKWQLFIAGAVDADIRGTESYTHFRQCRLLRNPPNSYIYPT